MAPVTSTTLTGVLELVVVPLPSCPSRFRPQHCTVPSPSSAQVCCYPAVTAMAPVMPPTRTGVVETSPAVLVPSCTSAFYPQQCTLPPSRLEQACTTPP